MKFTLNLAKVVQMQSREKSTVSGLLVGALEGSISIQSVSEATQILAQHLQETPPKDKMIAQYQAKYHGENLTSVSEKLTRYTTAMVEFLKKIGKSYSFTTRGGSTGQEPYNLNLHYEIKAKDGQVLPERITTFAHELTHEFDEKLAWEDMKKFLQEELINPDISQEKASALSNKMDYKNINLLEGMHKKLKESYQVDMKNALEKLQEQERCGTALQELHENLKAHNPELADRLRILQYNGTNSLYNKEKSNDFDYKDFVMYCVDRGKFGKKALEKNEKYENVLNGLGKICKTFGAYYGDSHIRELVARTQEDIISDGKEYGILQELQKKVGDKEPSISDLLGVINVVAEGHITKMKERGCNELLVNGWSNFQKEVNMLQKQVAADIQKCVPMHTTKQQYQKQHKITKEKIKKSGQASSRPPWNSSTKPNQEDKYNAEKREAQLKKQSGQQEWTKIAFGGPKAKSFTEYMKWRNQQKNNSKGSGGPSKY